MSVAKTIATRISIGAEMGFCRQPLNPINPISHHHGTQNMKNIRIGFIGAGWVGTVHTQSLAKIPGVEVVAVYNHNLPRAQSFIADHAPKAKAYDDWKKMLETEKLDAVYVGLPPGAHCGQTELAAQRGCHLFLEKPIALTLDRAQSIAAAVRAAGVKCQIGHHQRHTAPVRKLKQMLTDGSAGRPLLMQGRFFANNLFPAWWRDPNMGGGQLIEQAIHTYDLARHFFGEPEIVTAFADKLFHDRFPDYQVDDVSASTIRFKNRAIASLCAANCYEPHGGSTLMTILCEKVMVEFKSPDEATFVRHGGKKSEEIAKSDVKVETIKQDGSAYDEINANFIGALRGEATLRSGIDDGVESLRLVLAASKSSKENGAPQKMS